MKITQLQLFLLMWIQNAEALTDELIDLGQNVTINCDFDVKEVIWLLLNLTHSPVCILRSSSTSSTFHFKKEFQLKYSVQSKHRLFINNITLNELGVYYCLTTAEDPKYSDGTRLHITVPTPGIQNHTVLVKYTEKNQSQWQIVSLIFGLIIAVLILVIIGLIKVLVGNKKTRDNSKRSQDMQQQQPQARDLQPQDSSQVLYSTAHFSPSSRRFQISQVNSTYALLQLPSGKTHNHI